MRTKKQLGPLESMIHSDEDGRLDVNEKGLLGGLFGGGKL